MTVPLPVVRNRAGDSAAAPVNDQRSKIEADLSRLDVGEIRFDPHNRFLYSTDASLYQVEPIGVIIPRDAEAVRRAIQYCAAQNVAVLPRGGGTSLAGQGVNRAVVFDLSPNLRNVLEISESTRICQVQPGISIDGLNRILLERGSKLFFAVDPATTAQAAIGGCIGNNAAGARSIRYGRTSENLAAVQVILSTGESVWLEPGAGARDPIALRLAQQVIAIVRKYADEIRRRFPKLIRRNAGYGLDLILNQLDRNITSADLDLSGLICGSEGTLAIVTAARLKLHPIPAARGLAIASFDSVDAAVAAVPAILATGPSAVELLDDVLLSAARDNLQCRPYVDLIPKTSAPEIPAALFVEYQAESPDAPADQLDRKFVALQQILPALKISAYRDTTSMLRAWTLRKSGEALLHNVSATRKPVTFVEDNAIPVENLSRFVTEFRRIVNSHGTSAAYYAHASVGVLHVRPMLDLHNPSDLDAMRQIAREVADLARDCGGVMSGEHGDGRARGPLLEAFYGPNLMRAFAEIKRIFDPPAILNPGMIVNVSTLGDLTENLRIEKETRDISSAQTYFNYDDQQGFSSAVEQCNGAGFCRKTAGGTMCPSYRATLDERHSTRGRGNALRMAITGQSLPGENAWNDPATIQTLDLCLSCKACKTECPSNVDISRLKAEYTAQKFRASGSIPFRARAFGRIRALNRLGSIAPGLFNALSAFPPIRAATNHLLGLSPRRSLPPFARSIHKTFIPRPAQSDAPKVVIYSDCFSAYTEPQIAAAAARVAEQLGYAVTIPRIGCCGRSMISTGFLPAAVKTIDQTLSELKPHILDPLVKAILVCEPSCLSAIKDDWLQLRVNTPIDLRRSLAARAMLPEDFVHKFWNDHPIKPVLPEQSGPPVLLHGHCHQKALWGDETSAALVRRFAGDRLTVIPSGCCGMAGSFGFTADHYDLSMKIGELSVFPPIRNFPPDSILLAPGTSCRHQIHDALHRNAIHPIQWIAQQLENPPTRNQASR